MDGVQDEVERFAADIIAGVPETAIGACRHDRQLAADVSRRVAELLDDLDGPAWSPHDRSGWPEAQGGVVALAATGGADAGTLAGSLARAACRSHTLGSFRENPFDEAAVRLIIGHAPDVVTEIAELDSVGIYEPRYLFQRLWDLPDEEGLRWFEFLVERDSAMFAELAIEQDGSVFDWPASEWTEKLDRLAGLQSPGAKSVSEGLWRISSFVPDEALASLLRARVSHTGSPREALNAAADVRRRMSGGFLPSAESFAWPQEGPALERAAWVIAGSLGADRYEAVVNDAQSAGLISPTTAAAYLGVDHELPPRVLDAKWEFDRVESVGTLNIDSGIVAATDPTFFEGRFAWRVGLSIPEVTVRAAMAKRLGEMKDICVGVELELAPDSEVVEWTQLGEPSDEFVRGFMPENSAWGVADAKLFDEHAHDHLQSAVDIYFERARGEGHGVPQIVESDSCRMLIVGTAEQHNDCVSWLGKDSEGAPVAIFTTLGEVELDPTSAVGLPWRHPTA